jgi:hypothetical protein
MPLHAALCWEPTPVLLLHRYLDTTILQRAYTAQTGVGSVATMSGWGDAAAMVTAATAVIAVGGSYVQFVLKRSLLPSAESDVEFKPYVRGVRNLVAEVEVVVRNVGATMLIVTGVRCRVVCRLQGDADEVYSKKPTEPYFSYPLLQLPDEASHGPLALPPPSAIPSQPGSSPSSPPLLPPLPSSVPPLVGPSQLTEPPSEAWLVLVGPRTFIQPGVTQRYRKPIALPATTQLVHIWGAFDYRIELGWLTRMLVGLFARPPKDLDWRDKGVSNHTVRRTFYVDSALFEPPEGGEQPRAD